MPREDYAGASRPGVLLLTLPLQRARLVCLPLAVRPAAHCFLAAWLALYGGSGYGGFQIWWFLGVAVPAMAVPRVSQGCLRHGRMKMTGPPTHASAVPLPSACLAQDLLTHVNRKIANRLVVAISTEVTKCGRRSRFLSHQDMAVDTSEDGVAEGDVGQGKDDVPVGEDFTASIDVGEMDDVDDLAYESITFAGPVKRLPSFGPIASGKAAAIIVLSYTGGTARFIASYRPNCPVFVVSRDPMTIRQSYLIRGNIPLLYREENVHESWADEMNAQVHWTISYAVKNGILHQDDTVVVVLHGWRAQ